LSRSPRVDDILANHGFLVDTNVISHLIRPKRELDEGIRHFFETVDEGRISLSAVTIGEIQKGISLIPWPVDDQKALAARRALQANLETRLEALCDRFEGRIIVPDTKIFRIWGNLHADQQRSGRKTPIVDTLIAACAYSQRLTIVTADADFAAFAPELMIYNPCTQTLSSDNL
jgi:predicted nucleic acid-binding protein